MDNITISPKKLAGSINIPPSKSMGHRAIICASLSKGISHIDNMVLSDDMIATIEAMKSLGAKIEIEKGVEVDRLVIDGSKTFTKKDSFIDCIESGSTLRFLVPISIVKENSVNFVGQGNLGKRPLTTFYNIFDEQKINYSFEEDVLNLKINGSLKSGTFNVEGNISSQFISGLMFALPLLDGNSVINITTELESKGYLDLTLSMLKKFGITIENNNYESFIIKGNQQYTSCNYYVEGDYSQGAFYYAANDLGSNIDIKGLDKNSLQGDKEVIEILDKLKNSNTIVEIDASNCPDVIPVITVVAALRVGETNIINAGRLRIKECDRLTAISTLINKIGGNIIELPNSLIIKGVKNFKGGEVDSYDDHRIAMSMAIASTVCTEQLTINNSSCVKKSYPNFWKDFVSLGGVIT